MISLTGHKARDLQYFPISKNVNRAVGVGAQCRNTSLPQAFEELRTGMSVRIVFSGRNNAEAWQDGGKEFRSGGVLAAVMADLQNVRLPRCRVGFGKYVVPEKFFRVAGKKKTTLAEFDAEDQRVSDAMCRIAE